VNTAKGDLFRRIYWYYRKKGYSDEEAKQKVKEAWEKIIEKKRRREAIKKRIKKIIPDWWLESIKGKKKFKVKVRSVDPDTWDIKTATFYVWSKSLFTAKRDLKKIIDEEMQEIISIEEVD
jgi:uncharacterized membrane-anchored protein